MIKRRVICVMALCCSVNLTAAGQVVVKCEKTPGMVAGPFVSTVELARKIYELIVDSRHDKVGVGNVIEVSDSGDHWSIYQYPKTVPAPHMSKDGKTDTVMAVVGGGTPEMEIRKCDGAILNYHYSR